MANAETPMEVLKIWLGIWYCAVIRWSRRLAFEKIGLYGIDFER